MLLPVYPILFEMIATQKKELVAAKYRHSNKRDAE